MSKKLFYLFIVQIAILQSCVDQASDDIVFTLFNQTDKTVEVLGFNGSRIAEPIIIEPNSKFKITRVTGIDNDTGKAFYSVIGVDSVRVIFNNEKVIIYGGTTDNPCKICSGDDNRQHFITEEDYNNATDCDGDCE